MKKKVAIVTRKMVMGGIEKVLIEMMKTMLENDYEIDLYVMANGGELEDKIPENVQVINLYGNEKSVVEKIQKKIKEFKILEALKIGCCSLMALKFSKYGYEQEKWLGKIIKKVDKKYDLAIAYHVPASFPVIFVHEHLSAKKRIGWIHSDMSVYRNSMENYDKYYRKFDKVYCISNDTKDKFLEVYPDLKNKVDIFYNLVDEKEIKKLSEFKGFEDKNFKGQKLLTVGRLCKDKNQILIPDVLEKLLNDGYNLKWYLVGEGEDREIIKNKIKEKKLEKNLLLLGNKNNPYPYFKECDIYVQTSLFEGYCTTITEAKMFCNPIVATNFTSIDEQIKNDETGIITEKTIESIYLGIKKILNNKNLRDKISENLKKEKTNKKNMEIKF